MNSTLKYKSCREHYSRDTFNIPSTCWKHKLSISILDCQFTSISVVKSEPSWHRKSITGDKQKGMAIATLRASPRDIVYVFSMRAWVVCLAFSSFHIRGSETNYLVVAVTTCSTWTRYNKIFPTRWITWIDCPDRLLN